jgi:uncharacterized NAD(P)/FAD-binding protein YdhS
LECLEGATNEVINLNVLKHEIDLIKAYKGKSIPLVKLEGYYNKLGDLLKDGLESGKKCDFIMNSCVNKLVQNENGTYEVFISGNPKSIRANQIIIATGGLPHDITNENIAFSDNIPLFRYQNKSMHSDTILKSGVPNNFKIELDKKPKVVILGGSHSAFSVAHFLLHSEN